MSKILDFLSKTAPFDQLPTEQLTMIAESGSMFIHEHTGILYEQNKTVVEGLDILISGEYEAFFLNGEGEKKLTYAIKAGENYGAFSILLNKGKSIKTVKAVKNTEVYRIPGKIFRELCKNNEKFYQNFLTDFGKEMLHEQFARYVSYPTADVEALSFDRYFIRKMETIDARPIIKITEDTPAYEAAQLMEANRISCIFVADENDISIGYITDIILRNQIVGARRSAETPVNELMEGPIYKVTTEDFVYEAILLMFNFMIRYLIIEKDGKEIGVISRSKLLSDQAQSPFVFIQSVRLAVTVDELKKRWAEVPEKVYHLLTRGVKSELVNQIITSVSDNIAEKVIDGVIKEIGPPPAKFVFMSLGSEGRMEQTLKTDQDNAIIYEDKANEFREKTRKYFLHFATLVSERLDYIGFSFCTGGLMAKNPKWTHSLSHWKRNYNEWIANPDPQSVMNFSTFFDCRYIYGEESLIDELKAHILEKLSDPGEYFFVQLANNALQYEPPLTFFKGIKTIAKGDRQVFNIKRAMSPIADLVRAYALQHKILKTNTENRLIGLKEAGVFSEEEFHELMQSYYYLMGMRLRYQAQQIIKDHVDPHNYVAVDSLTKIEVVTLKEIFKVIEKFQQRIKMEFTRSLFG